MPNNNEMKRNKNVLYKHIQDSRSHKYNALYILLWAGLAALYLSIMITTPHPLTVKTTLTNLINQSNGIITSGQASYLLYQSNNHLNQGLLAGEYNTYNLSAQVNITISPPGHNLTNHIALEVATSIFVLFCGCITSAYLHNEWEKGTKELKEELEL